MKSLEIKNKILSEIKGHECVVIKDTEEGGIWGTDASASNIRSGGGVLAIIDKSSIKNDYVIWAGKYIMDLDEVSKEIEEYWN